MGIGDWLRRRGGPLVTSLAVGVLAAVVVYEYDRANAPPPVVYDWQSFPLIPAGEGNAFPGATSLRRWNGLWAIRGERAFVIHPGDYHVRVPSIPGVADVLDVGSMGDRPAALVTQDRGGATRLLVRAADGRGWEEHAIPEPFLAGVPHLQLSTDTPGVAVWADRRVFFLVEGTWHEATTSQPIRDVFWQGGRWLVHTIEVGGCFTGSSRVEAFGPSGDPLPANGGDAFERTAAGTPVRDRNGAIWELDPVPPSFEEARPWHAAATVASPPRDGPPRAIARGVEWDFGSLGSFTTLTFDDANRPIVGLEQGGLFRLQASGELLWLTPGWRRGKPRAALVSDRGSVVLTGTGRVAVLAPQPWIIRWLDPPADRPVVGAGTTWTHVAHATIVKPAEHRGFPYVLSWEPTLEALPVDEVLSMVRSR